MDRSIQAKQKQAGILKWTILLIAVGSYLMGFIVRFAWPPVIAVAAPDLGIDMTRAGLYMSAFYIGYVATHIPAGFMADRFGVRFIIAGALAVEGLSSIGMAHIGSFGPGFLLRICTGLGAGMVYAACVRSVTTWFEPKERGAAFGLLMLSPTAGVLFSNQIAAVVMRYFEWRTVFTSVGVAAMALAVFVVIFMKDTGESSKGSTFLEGFRYITGNRDIMRMAMAGFCLMWVQIGFISWANAAIKSCGLTFANGAFIMTLFGIGGIVGPFVSGVLADRTNNKKSLMVIGFGILIPLVLGFGAVNTLAPMAVTACALGFVFGYINTFLPLMVAEYSGPQWAASAGGITGCIFQSGAILGPAILGLTIDLTGSFQAVWWLLAAGPVAGTFFLVSLQRPKIYPVRA